MKTGIYWQDPKYALKPGRDFIFDPSLVLYLPLYRLDGASFMSRDAYGRLCTVTGALWTPRGRSFDGSDDKITVPNHSALDITSEVTVEAWVKTSKSSVWQAILTKGTSTTWANNNYVLGIRNDNYFVFKGTFGSAESTTLANTTDWFFVTGMVNNTNITLFINGSVNRQVAIDNAPTTVDQDLILGTDDGTDDFGGLIGEVRVYSRALTPLEIQHNYLATKWRYQ